MKKIIYILLLFFLLGTYNGFAQESKLFVDEEDQELQEDLYLSENDFFKKYVEKYEGADTKFFLKSYKALTDPEIKIYILKAVIKKGLNDENVFKIFKHALGEGIVDSAFNTLTRVSDRWRVRAAASYLLWKNPTGMDDKVKLALTKILVLMLREDPEERCQGMAALALGKLFSEGDKSDGDGKLYKRYNLLRKTTIVAIINYKLEKISINDQYLCWTLVKSLGYLKSQKSFFVLLEARRKGFNQKVKIEISRSVQAITGGGSSSPSKK